MILFTGKEAILYTEKEATSHNQNMKSKGISGTFIPMVLMTKFKIKKNKEDIKMKQNESINAAPSVTKTKEIHTQETPMITPHMKKNESTKAASSVIGDNRMSYTEDTNDPTPYEEK